MLNQILSAILNVLAILGIITPQVILTAKEHFQYVIETAVLNIDTRLQDGTSGLAAIASANASYAAGINTKLDAIAAQITAYTPVPTVVSLPTIPPTGYGAPDVASIADAVWFWRGGPYGAVPGDLLADAAYFPVMLSQISWPAPIGSGKFYTETGDWGSSFGPSRRLYQPIWPVANILSTDTLSTFLERESTNTGWVLSGDGTFYSVADASTGWTYQTVMSPGDFLTYKESLFPVAPRATAPVWPGLALVTLGTPVAFTGPTNVNVPMHGILIEIDSVPPGKPQYVFGSQTANGHIGAVAFIDDDQEMEYSQQLSFNYQVYCCQSMVIAGGVKLRCVPGVTGIITPWTIT